MYKIKFINIIKIRKFYFQKKSYFKKISNLKMNDSDFL